MKSKKITREEYLNKSFKLQSIIFGGNILFLLVCYFSGIEAIIMALIFLVINAMATIAFWLNIKRYKQI